MATQGELGELKDDIKCFRHDLAATRDLMVATREQIAEFRGTWVARSQNTEESIKTLNKTVYGNGWPGLKAQVATLYLIVTTLLTIFGGIVVWKFTEGG